MMELKIGDGFQALEDRTLLAGNVTAAVTGTSLDIEGDAMDNNISVTQASNGDVTVTGVNGTTVNGLASVVYHASDLTSVTDITVNGNDGNDSLSIKGLDTTANLSINGNAGNDTVALSNTQVNDLSLDGGAGNNAVLLASSQIAGNLTVNGDTGNDTLSLFRSTVDGSTTLSLGDGSNSVSIFDADLGSSLASSSTALAYTGGTGNDILVLNDVSVHNGAADLSLGDGNNRLVALNSDFDAGLGFTTGSGDDSIRLVKVDANGLLDSSTGAGDDSVFLQHVDLTAGQSATLNPSSLDLGDGNDRLNIMHSSIDGDLSIVGGAGKDRMMSVHSTFDGAATVDLGDGNDTLMALHNSFNGGGSIDGGLGTDRFHSIHNKLGTLTDTGFEKLI